MVCRRLIELIIFKKWKLYSISTGRLWYRIISKQQRLKQKKKKFQNRSHLKSTQKWQYTMLRKSSHRLSVVRFSAAWNTRLDLHSRSSYSVLPRTYNINRLPVSQPVANRQNTLKMPRLDWKNQVGKKTITVAATWLLAVHIFLGFAKARLWSSFLYRLPIVSDWFQPWYCSKPIPTWLQVVQRSWHRSFLAPYRSLPRLRRCTEGSNVRNARMSGNSRQRLRARPGKVRQRWICVWASC